MQTSKNAKKKKVEQELLRNNARIKAVLKSIGDGLIVIMDVDKGGRIVFVNKMFEEMTGWKLHEVLNKRLVEILPRENKYGEVVPFRERIVSKVLSGEKVVSDLIEPFYYLRKDKTKFPVASVITPIILNKKIIGAVEAFRDISKESQADKSKTEFASLVSHQLRTPFATINWYVELLLSADIGELNEKQKEYLEEVYKASKRMVTLINVLLSVSRIQMGITEIEKKLIDIVLLAKTIINEEKQMILKKNLKIEEIYDKNIPKIMADPKQLIIIFQNLITNAIKYSFEKGKISLKIGRKGNDITITVSDHGIGIPEAAHPQIFNRFFRAENAKAKEPEGVGLGLYIVKEVINIMNGNVSFKSQENKGASFYVTIPIKESTKLKKGGVNDYEFR